MAPTTDLLSLNMIIDGKGAPAADGATFETKPHDQSANSHRAQSVTNGRRTCRPGRPFGIR